MQVIRIVSRSSFDAHANPIFVSLRILKFEDIIKLQKGKVKNCTFIKRPSS